MGNRRELSLITTRVLGVSGLFWGIGGALYLVAETVAAHAFPSYSYSQDYISLLGEPASSPHSAIMNAGFIGEGVLYLIAVCLSFFALPKGIVRLNFLTLGLAHGVGSILVGIFHSGPLAPGAFHFHLTGAFLAIAGGNLASACFPTLACGLGLPKQILIASKLLGFGGLACLLMLGVNIVVGSVIIPNAVWERAAVYPVSSWELMVAATLIRSTTPEIA